MKKSRIAIYIVAALCTAGILAVLIFGAPSLNVLSQEWWKDCPPDPPTRTPWPEQPTLAPQPTLTPNPTPTCRPTATLAPNPSPMPYPSPTPYPTHTPYPTQPYKTPVSHGAYRYAGVAATGLADGTDWDNQWAYNAIDWAALQALAAAQPTYLFFDQGTYPSTLHVAASGSSHANRIFIMPGYAAQQMGLPGNHAGHTGQVVWDLAGADAWGISVRNRHYITLDGYSDPRPSAGNAPKFVVRDVNGNTAALVLGSGSASNITVRNLELYQETNSKAGDAVIFTSPPHSDRHILIERCYIHDGGYYNAQQRMWYAAIWIDGPSDTIVRYCEIRDWGRTGDSDGEGVGFWDGHQTGSQVYRNLFVNVGVPVLRATYIRFNTFYGCRHPVACDPGVGETGYVENNLFDGSEGECINYGGANKVRINANVFHDVDGVGWIFNEWYTTPADLNANSEAKIVIESDNRLGAANYLRNPPGDLRLAPEASNAIDGAHTTNWQPSQDFLGNSGQGSNWDIGAYEYTE